tara:strand:+ start:606 stop:1556 length:951 start_codon:yes stop_codon:yes gene_type:complete
LEEQILHYYLKTFSLLILLFLIFIFKILFYDNLNFKDDYIRINKNQIIENIVTDNIEEDYNYKINIYIYFMKFYNNLYKHIHYGDFKIDQNSTFYEFLNIISQPSNKLSKITIVEGWQEYQLQKLLNLHYNNYDKLNYFDIIADTYLINSSSDFNELKKLFIQQKNKLNDKYKNHKLFKKYSFNELMIIASLIEKEGINYEDKKIISSVIFNRINKNMKLQIDASVIYSITKGKYKFNRQLNKKDLKIKDKYNTYFIKYLPPEPICYVGSKTIELIFEDFKSDYYYYFYDKNKEIHIYSKTYKEHLNKLNEYRKKN